MCNVIPYPCAQRTRQRLRRYLKHLQQTRRNRPVELSPQERALIRTLRNCSPQDRDFIHRAATALHSTGSTPTQPPKTNMGENHE